CPLPSAGHALRVHGYCAPGGGSSRRSIASEALPAPRIFEVTRVLNVNVKFTVGMNWSTGVGLPPVQDTMTSPTSSVVPSARIGRSSLTAEVHTCAETGAASA